MTEVINTIRISMKANKLSIGDALIEKVRNNKAYIVLAAKDSGYNSLKRVQDKCKFYNVPCYVVLNSEIMTSIFNRHVAALGITDKNLANKLKENLMKEGILDEEKNIQ